MPNHKNIDDKINILCNKLDTNMFLGKESRENILKEIEKLVEEREIIRKTFGRSKDIKENLEEEE